jgi:hypothetical protein
MNSSLGLTRERRARNGLRWILVQLTGGINHRKTPMRVNAVLRTSSPSGSQEFSRVLALRSGREAGNPQLVALSRAGGSWTESTRHVDYENPP